MFGVVVAIFMVCWAPYHIYFILSFHFPNITRKEWISNVYLAVRIFNKMPSEVEVTLPPELLLLLILIPPLILRTLLPPLILLILFTLLALLSMLTLHTVLKQCLHSGIHACIIVLVFIWVYDFMGFAAKCWTK